MWDISLSLLIFLSSVPLLFSSYFLEKHLPLQKERDLIFLCLFSKILLINQKNLFLYQDIPHIKLFCASCFFYFLSLLSSFHSLLLFRSTLLLSKALFVSIFRPESYYFHKYLSYACLSQFQR